MNLFTAVATHLVASGVSEAYVVADDELRAIGAAGISSIISQLTSDLIKPVDRLGRDFNRCESRGGKYASFTDDAAAYILVEGVAVEFTVSKISATAYRVLFHVVDAGKLLTNTQARLDAVEKQIHALTLTAKNLKPAERQ